MNIRPAHDTMLIEELFYGLAASVDAFLIDREARKCRPATMIFYKRELGYFLKWAPAYKVEGLKDITPQLLRMYFIELGKTRKKANSIHAAYRPIKTWLKWAWEEYQIESRCPIERVKVEPPEEEPKPGIPLQDVDKLIAACTGRNGSRDIALFLFLLDTGIRRQELVLLNVGDLNRDGSIMIRTTKNKISRKAHLIGETRRALADYLQTRKELSKVDPLFATEEGGRFTPTGLYQVLRRRSKEAGIDPVGLHAFRRTFALESYRAGAGEINTSRLLGHGNNHGDLNITKRYFDLQDDDLRKAHEASSPVKKLKKIKRK
ncbi:MAG: site-specific integrase [Anaerolineaceae bacterium]|nr:site-specific integrase [Anaerolineaceae bacterium]